MFPLARYPDPDGSPPAETVPGSVLQIAGRVPRACLRVSLRRPVCFRFRCRTHRDLCVDGIATLHEANGRASRKAAGARLCSQLAAPRFRPRGRSCLIPDPDCEPVPATRSQTHDVFRFGAPRIRWARQRSRGPAASTSRRVSIECGIVKLVAPPESIALDLGRSRLLGFASAIISPELSVGPTESSKAARHSSNAPVLKRIAPGRSLPGDEARRRRFGSVYCFGSRM